MALSEMYSLKESEITSNVKNKQAGVYVLDNSTDSPFKFQYVGRSDDDLPGRLRKWIGKYRYFKFDYSSSAKDAFEMECRLYHENKPPDNTIHPDRPDGTNYKCPVSGCRSLG